MTVENTTIPYCKHNLGDEEIAAVVEVLKSGWIARGPKMRQFEDRCSEVLGARHAIACTNGSAALEIALRALGIGPGDEVIVPTLTWVATAAAVRMVGARPVFADVGGTSHNLTPEAVVARWSPRTKAVIAVDFAGVPHDVVALRAVVDARGAFLIEDAAHAFGARFEDGSRVGSDGHAHITTFSFHPAKTLTTAEGGLICCEDDRVADRIRVIRSGGVTRDFVGSRGRWDIQVNEIGSNYHLSELQAALGCVQLDRLDDLLAQRRVNGIALRTALADAVGDHLLFPVHPEGSSWNLFIVELTGDATSTDRDLLLAELGSRGVRAHVHYPLLHRQPVFARDVESYQRFPVAERYVRRAFTLPLFPDLTGEDIYRIVAAVEVALFTTLRSRRAS